MPLQPIPAWLENALQGMAYWVGYRRLLFDGYHLPEAALITETCSLLAHHLPRNFSLVPEVRYATIVPATKHHLLPRLRMRADLILYKKLKDWPQPRPRFVVEVKRAAAPEEDIEEDLRRLAILKSCRSRLRCFLFVFSELGRPADFVGENGGPVKGSFDIREGHYYRVRRTFKAVPLFSDKEKGHYACLVEVLTKRNAKRRKMA